MEATILDSAQFAYLSDEYQDGLRAHWAVAMAAAIKAKDAREKQARREEELGDYAQGNRPRSCSFPPQRYFRRPEAKHYHNHPQHPRSASLARNGMRTKQRINRP